MNVKYIKKNSNLLYCEIIVLNMTIISQIKSIYLCKVTNSINTMTCIQSKLQLKIMWFYITNTHVYNKYHPYMQYILYM
jgi:hypothetical protein